jgi:hypothetical protein
MDEETWRGGLAPHYDYMLPGKPDDPAMRESASVWVFEENGEFALPRVGIEAIGATWDRHRVDMNAAFPGGRVMVEIGGGGATHSPLGPHGMPTILGSGGLRFECIEPYPPAEDGSTYNEGYVYQDGTMYPAVATKIPWLGQLGAKGQDTSLELQSELGITRIDAVSCLSTFKIMSEGEMAGFALQQGGSKYSWGDQSAYGMIERSTWLNKL